MSLSAHIPGPQLRPFIRQMWITEEEKPLDVRVKSFPVGYPYINVNLGEDFIIFTQNHQQRLANSYLVGAYACPFTLEMKKIKRGLTLQLQPWALSFLYPASAVELAHKRISLNQLDEGLTRDLEEALFTAQNHREALLKAEDYLLARIRPRSFDARVLHSIQLILQHKGSLTIKELADQANLSLRRLQQLFREMVGLSPKAWSNIARMQHHSYELLLGNTMENLVPDSYYDQSHFIRELKKQTGMRPGEFQHFLENSIHRDSYRVSNLFFQPKYKRNQNF